MVISAFQPVTEKVILANAWLMDDTPMVDLLNPQSKSITSVGSGFMPVTVPAKSALVLAPKQRDLGGYSRYKQVKERRTNGVWHQFCGIAKASWRQLAANREDGGLGSWQH